MPNALAVLASAACFVTTAPVVARFASLARAAMFALVPPAAAGGAMAIAMIVSIAGAASLTWTGARELVEKKPLPILLLLAFAGWAVVSATWSPAPAGAQAAKIFFLATLGLAFAGAAMADARLTRAAGIAAFAVLALFLSVEAFADMPINRATHPGVTEAWKIGRDPARGAVVLLAMTWGVAAALWIQGGRWRLLALLALGLCGVLAAQFDQAANLVGFALGLAAGGLALLAPRLAPIIVSWGLAFWLLAAPLLTPFVVSNRYLVDQAPYGWAVRAGIWDYVVDRIGERPIFGHGLDASHAVTDQIVVRGDVMRAVPLHPHSASLHIWFDTGLIGALLAAGALLTGGLAISRACAQNRAAAAAACATLASLGFIANVSYGVWQEWWDATLFLAAAIVSAAAATKRSQW